jgi:hypothetical protein
VSRPRSWSRLRTSSLRQASNCELEECEEFRGRTVHGISLDGIVAVIFGEKEVEVGSRVCNHSDFILLVDEVAVSCEHESTASI